MERRAVVIRGIVQGVGFRPFVYHLATGLKLRGFVQNQSGTLRIEAEGEPAALDQLVQEITRRPPPLASVEHWSSERIPERGDPDFRIESSGAIASAPVYISPDVATCSDCLRELDDPENRRFGYPFLNCTNCGPRLTIILGAPYDRARTTMDGFPMCPECREEYDDPLDRRFHAQPTACAVCGPRLQLLDASGQAVSTGDPLRTFAAMLRAGGIGAMKGLGGYHLVCDAANAMAVAELRTRKHRDEKPFAIMVPDLEGAEALAQVTGLERSLLVSPRRPIVLLAKRGPAMLAEEVAPGNPFVGVMLPYTPLHYLLLRSVEGRPLVMTSGNRSDEPIAYLDDQAVHHLAGIADQFLIHDRPIHVRCDDSVTRVVDGIELPIRRSRGYAPRPVPLPTPCPRPMLAVGGQLKSTFALGRGQDAILSHHMGDLDHLEAYRAFVRDIHLYEELFEIRPECLVHDLHPDYASTRYARDRAEAQRTRIFAVQHHHAHLASCMTEHGLKEPVIGVTFDGTGYGSDGAIWGGEFLVGDCKQFRRAAHLRYVGLPGGDRAIHEPWRMASAHLRDAQITTSPLTARVAPVALRTIMQMLERGFQTPLTSSAGRLFDAVAAIAGVRDRVSYEGQAAIELEWLATGSSADGAYPFAIEATDSDAPLVIDTRPLIRAVSDDARNGVESAAIARRFHTTMVELITEVCKRLRSTTTVNQIVLSGGVFLNALLTVETCARLRACGFQVYRHQLVPPNDAGLSLGQLAIGASLDLAD